MTLLRITTPTACGGLVVEGGLVTAAAPFLKEFLEGQRFAYPKRESLVRHVCEARGWTVETVQPHEKVDPGDPLDVVPPGGGCPSLARRLEEMLWPERFPPGHPRHNPGHVFWDGVESDPFGNDWVEPYQWDADTIEWVSELVTKELEKVEPEPDHRHIHTWERTGATIDVEGLEPPASREWECVDCHATAWAASTPREEDPC